MNSQIPRFEEFSYVPRFGSTASGLSCSLLRATLAGNDADLPGPSTTKLKPRSTPIFGSLLQTFHPTPPNVYPVDQQKDDKLIHKRFDDSLWYIPRFGKNTSLNPDKLLRETLLGRHTVTAGATSSVVPKGSQLQTYRPILPNSSQADRQKDKQLKGKPKLFKPVKERLPHCQFCLSNGETRQYYTSHLLKNAQGQITCPILRKYVCPRCGATGDVAHTLKYCPLSPVPLPKHKPIRLNAVGRLVVTYN